MRKHLSVVGKLSLCSDEVFEQEDVLHTTPNVVW